MNTMKINDQVTVSGQPTDDELKEIASQGFKSIVNFRAEGEEEHQLSPSEEGKIVEALGLSYVHIPVSLKALNSESVDQFREQYEKLPKPVFAHCKSGKRAGAMVMMHLAVEQGMSGERALRQAEEMGFQCDQPELKQFVETYVDQNAKTIT